LGEKIITLVSEQQQAGYHQIEWDASGYASGVYFYQLKTDSQMDMKKMILVQ
jgi:hypothetical protein